MPPRRSTQPIGPPTLYDAAGRRLWLTQEELHAFLHVLPRQTPLQTFCTFLVYTGCWVSEACAVPVSAIDFRQQTVRLSPWVTAQGATVRALPLPPGFLDTVIQTHHLRVSPQRARLRDESLLWPWSRMTAWRRVKQAMHTAGLSGPQATARGIRHGFGVAAVRAGIPLDVLQKWMGHADATSTVAYLHSDTRNEPALMARLWQDLTPSREETSSPRPTRRRPVWRAGG